MANPIEIVRDYMGSVVDRTIGISAWRAAMQQPRRLPDNYYQYSWSIPINHALDTAAPVHAALEFLTPATSRLITSLLRTTKEGNLERYDLFKARFMIPTMAIDIALLAASVFLGQNLLEVVIWKLGGNVAFQVGSDLAHRIRGSRPPTATTLAV